jgi:ribosomal protein S18 acetylase RimI-like enzyme
LGGEDAKEGIPDNVSDPPTLLRVGPLAPQHAKAAARLHLAGQPSTFLTSLGPDVLEVVYAALPRTQAGFGFVAYPDGGPDSPDAIAGFVSATTGVGRLFIETGVRHAGKLARPLLARLARNPALIGRSVQTALYPLLVRGRDAEEPGQRAELLSIMVEQQWRSRGIGTLLLNALIAECAARGITHLDVTVDANNQGAQRFYARHAFRLQRSFRLYERQMCQYGRRV